jgi:hypothetical protein
MKKAAYLTASLLDEKEIINRATNDDGFACEGIRQIKA